jgi:hypothetical protein
MEIIKFGKHTDTYKKQIPNDLIDKIWTTGRPAQPNSTINALPIGFSGNTVKPVRYIK